MENGKRKSNVKFAPYIHFPASLMIANGAISYEESADAKFCIPLHVALDIFRTVHFFMNCIMHWIQNSVIYATGFYRSYKYETTVM